jgi:chromatin remodeling complex protein RSC6
MNHARNGAKRKHDHFPTFMTPVKPDDKLSAVIGGNPISRSELFKRLWEYIRKHGLQDKQRRTIINADGNLRGVFDGKTQVTMFEMTELVFSHLLP